MQLDQQLFAEPGRLVRIGRPRLENRLIGAGAAPITVLVGPAGCGKGEVVRALRNRPGTLYYRVGNRRGTFARFVHGLAQAVAALAPGALASFPRAWERALQSASPSAVLGRWLCEHLNEHGDHIIIGDLHDAASDLGIASFIETIAELRPHARLTIATRSVGALPIALWMATGRMERPIDEAELRFDRAEFLAAATRFGVPLDDAEADMLLDATGGSPVAVAYALTQFAGKPRGLPTTRMPASFEGIAERVFARRTARERRFLFTAALFPSVDDDLLAHCGWDDAAAVRAAMGADAPFMWERCPRRGFRFHDRFRDYLARQFQTREPEFRSTTALRVAQTLLLRANYAGALEVATSQRLIATMGELLDAHGFTILEAGEIDVISETFAALTAAEGSLGASALALHGYVEARAGHLDTAEAWFRLGLDQAPDEVSRAAIAMYYARELGLRRREDACEVLAPFADSTTLPRHILTDVRSSFAQSLTTANRFAEATARTSEALVLLGPDSPPALRARVMARAAYVALENGSVELARERATIAAPLAVAQCLYDVAASTYSVLYNIAYSIDDDPVASLKHLYSMRDLGAKSGTLRLDLYVLLNRYELHAEAGDEAALLDVERQLAHVDKHDSGADIIETLLPGKALQATWLGDFHGAHRLLRPSAGQQPSPVRRAVCWARIGLYRAAAGDGEGAQEAFGKAQEPPAESELGTISHGLTLLTLALGTLIDGKIDRAREWLSAADDATLGRAPRLRALRSVIAAMLSGWEAPDRFAPDVSQALAGLWTVSYGGMAKLIEALPHPFAQAACARAAAGPETIGSLLAQRELPARFAAALEPGAAGALRTWLDGMPGSTFERIALAERFDAWCAELTGLERPAPGALRDLRRQLAAYRRPAPAILRLVDETDAAIDSLIERLEGTAPLMAEHSRAVSAWCSRLGRYMNLSEAEITFVSRCGLIHDIGKMRTPAEILTAPRGLSPEEWAIMREHAAEGGRIVNEVPQLRAFTPIVRAHHERLDGKGYPDGLRSSAIPTAARIVAVADSFNAMTGRRPYRLPLAPTAALDELRRGRDTQFDPEIVEAMVRVVLGRLAHTPTP